MKRHFTLLFLICSVFCFAQDTKGTIKVKKADTVRFDTPLAEALDLSTMPSFPGGEIEMNKFLATTVKYPQMELEMGIQGTVYFSFVVTEDGSLTDIKLLRGVPGGPGCDKEAMRVLKMMPKWVPAKKEEKSVKARINLPIKFKIQ